MTNIVKDRIRQVQSGIIPYGYTWKWHLMPVTWKDVSLSEIFSSKAPKNKGNQFGIVFTNSAEHGIIPQSDYFDKIIANQENIEGYYIVRPGDYVYNPRISENAPYGPFRRNNTGITGIVSPLYTVLIPKSGYKHSEFLRYYLESDQWYKYAYSIANYGARFDRMNITSQDLMELPIALPPIDEQKKIAEILAQCDKVIELKRQRIAEEEKNKKCLGQKLLTPSRCDTGAWRNVCLRSLCKEIVDGDWIESKDQSDKGIRLIQTGNIGVGKYLDKPNRAKYISDRTFSDLNCTEVFNGDVLVSRLPDPIGRACLIEGLQGRAITAVDCSILRFDNLITAKLFVQIASTSKYFNEISVLAGGSTRTRIARKEIERLKITIPISIDRQKEILRILSEQDKLIDALVEEIELSKNKKRALMQLLLTGIVRVKP